MTRRTTAPPAAGPPGAVIPAEKIGRRGELMAEVFLEGLDPAFLGRGEFRNFHEFDFFAGFRNGDGGFNTWPVEVLATANPVGETGRYRLPRSRFEPLARSSPPVLLLVADALRSELFYAWSDRAEPEPAGEHGGIELYTVPVRRVDEAGRGDVLARLTEPPARAAARAGGKAVLDIAKAAA